VKEQTIIPYTVLCLEIGGKDSNVSLPEHSPASTHHLVALSCLDSRDYLLSAEHHQQASAILLIGEFLTDTAEFVKQVRHHFNKPNLPVFGLISYDYIDDKMRVLADVSEVQLLPRPITSEHLWRLLQNACEATTHGHYQIQSNRRNYSRLPITKVGFTRVASLITDISAGGAKFLSNHPYKKSETGQLHLSTDTLPATNSIDFETIAVTASDDKNFNFTIHVRFLAPQVDLVTNIHQTTPEHDPFV